MITKKLNDKWFRFLGIPIVALMGHVIFYNRNETGDERFGFWGIYLFSVAETMILWEGNRLGILYFRRKYPTLQQTRHRILMILVVCTIITVIIRTLNIYLYDRTLLWSYHFPIEAYLQSIFVALLFVIILGGIYEGIYYFSKWKYTAVEAESLKKENLQTQLTSLKTQINPHFLFNSLGSLTSLIEENPVKAQEFVIEMSSVYRYLLQSNEHPLISLRKEMDFIKAYSIMLKTRFEEGLQLLIDIDDRCWDLYLPPITIQILLENAVKHNAVLAFKPLQVKIFTDDTQHLIVENNLQLKTSPVLSNKMGLKNIVAKYKLLDQPEIIIKETSSHFMVSVPLIKNRSHANIIS